MLKKQQQVIDQAWAVCKLVRSIKEKLKSTRLNLNLNDFLKSIKGNFFYSRYKNFHSNINHFFKKKLTKRESDLLWILHSKDFDKKSNHPLAKLVVLIGNARFKEDPLSLVGQAEDILKGVRQGRLSALKVAGLTALAATMPLQALKAASYKPTINLEILGSKKPVIESILSIEKAAVGYLDIPDFDRDKLVTQTGKITSEMAAAGKSGTEIASIKDPNEKLAAIRQNFVTYRKVLRKYYPVVKVTQDFLSLGCKEKALDCDTASLFYFDAGIKSGNPIFCIALPQHVMVRYHLPELYVHFETTSEPDKMREKIEELIAGLRSDPSGQEKLKNMGIKTKEDIEKLYQKTHDLVVFPNLNQVVANSRQNNPNDPIAPGSYQQGALLHSLGYEYIYGIHSANIAVAIVTKESEKISSDPKLFIPDKATSKIIKMYVKESVPKAPRHYQGLTATALYHMILTDYQAALRTFIYVHQLSPGSKSVVSTIKALTSMIKESKALAARHAPELPLKIFGSNRPVIPSILRIEKSIAPYIDIKGFDVKRFVNITEKVTTEMAKKGIPGSVINSIIDPGEKIKAIKENFRIYQSILLKHFSISNENIGCLSEGIRKKALDSNFLSMFHYEAGIKSGNTIYLVYTPGHTVVRYETTDIRLHFETTSDAKKIEKMIKEYTSKKENIPKLVKIGSGDRNQGIARLRSGMEDEFKTFPSESDVVELSNKMSDEKIVEGTIRQGSIMHSLGSEYILAVVKSDLALTILNNQLELYNMGKPYDKNALKTVDFLCNDAIKTAPKYYNSYYVLARLLMQNGETSKAKALFKKALSLNPGSESVNKSLDST